MFFVVTDCTRIERPPTIVVIRSSLIVATEIVALLQSHGMRVPVQGGRHDAQRYDDDNAHFVTSRHRPAHSQKPQNRQRVRANNF